MTVVVEDCCPYYLDAPDSVCANEKFCVWLVSKEDLTLPVPNGINGMDFGVNYDASLMLPTGVYTLGPVVTNGGAGGAAYLNINAAEERVHTSIHYTGDLDQFPQFVGDGRVICIEFIALSSFLQGAATLTAYEVREGYLVDEILECADPVTINATGGVGNSLLTAQVRFWNDPSPNKLLSAGPGYIPTEVYSVDLNCARDQVLTTTDANGSFTYDANNGPQFQLYRDIPGKGPGSTTNACDDIMDVINAMDCFDLGQVTTFQPMPVPNPYQMIAGDVNMNDVLGANDITLIQKRIVLKYCDYPQAWNIATWPTSNSLNGNPPSFDWRFVSANLATTSPKFAVTDPYPYYDGDPLDLGYYRDNVPDADTCLTLNLTDDNGCIDVQSDNFVAILLGDFNGSWETTDSPVAKTASRAYSLVFDVKNAQLLADDVYRIPVYANSDTTVVAMDFDADYDQSRLQILSLGAYTNVAGHASMVWNNYQNDRVLLTSYTLQRGGFPLGVPVYYLEVKVNSAQELPADALGQIKGYLNGKPAEVAVTGLTPTHQSLRQNDLRMDIMAYPNPTDGSLTLQVSSAQADRAEARLVDLLGRTVATYGFDLKPGDQRFEIDMTGLADGVYFLKTLTSQGQATIRVVNR